MESHQYRGKKRGGARSFSNARDTTSRAFSGLGQWRKSENWRKGSFLWGGADTYRIVDLSGSGPGRWNYNLRAPASDA
jgi:hypothetical protein